MATISLCMIVRDEEQTLARCLDSICGLVDEIILVDTGSVDRTVEIAGKYTEKIFYFPWIDDFSAARNFSLEQAGMEFCMWMDADDILPAEYAENFRKRKRELDQTTDMVMMPYETAFDTQGRPTFVYERERILRRSAGFRFFGRVHEAVPLAGKVVRWDIEQFFHKGDQTVVEWSFRNEMNDGTVEEFHGLSLVRSGIKRRKAATAIETFGSIRKWRRSGRPLTGGLCIIMPENC